jgi:hypothetical protein
MRRILYQLVRVLNDLLNRPDVGRTAQQLWLKSSETSITAEQFNAEVAEAIRSGRPILVGRPGSFEAQICNDYLRFRHHKLRAGSYSEKVRRSVEAAHRDGFPLRSDHDLDVFAEAYMQAAIQSDVLAVWQLGLIGHEFLLRHTPTLVGLSDIDPTFCHLRGIEPWTTSLEGKRVLVVHPFKESIEEQFKNRARIKTVNEIMPEFDLQVVVPPQTYAGWQPGEGETWATLLQRTTAEIASHDFDVAIVAAGPYGLPIAAFVKAMGRPAIHLGGATQLLFGIRGRRWDDRDDFNRAFDDSWVRPLPIEVPPQSGRFEKSPYW